IATNPPGFGVNWKWSMDVGIRAANWILAHQLFARAGATFDAGFSAAHVAGIRDHGRYIVSNLEWDRGRRANHYIGDIAGLLYCAAALAPSCEADRWLIFAVHELVAEADHQLRPDGGHFEASTAYHRFALDMLVFAAAAAHGLDPARVRSLEAVGPIRVGGRTVAWPGIGNTNGVFPERWWDRIGRAAAFLEAVIAPDGGLVQIGDNDSGRMFKVFPSWTAFKVAEARRAYDNLTSYAELPDDATYWVEDPLECTTILAAVRALRGEEAADTGTDPRAAAAGALLRAIAAGRPTPATSAVPAEPATHAVAGNGSPDAALRGDTAKPDRTRVFEAPGADLREGLELMAFPDFGCYVYRSARVYLVVRCWTWAPAYTAHLHNDQLAVVLWLDGVERIGDPGAYLYTPIRAERDRYRSVRAHDTPWPETAGEPAGLDGGPFRIEEMVPARVLRLDPASFEGFYEVGGKVVRRRVTIEADRVLIEDWGSGPTAPPPGPPRSVGYGIREAVRA
ncbi:MAG TPA: heparinase II/III family protein, partial [Candidatus Limnocylindrales bacterium]|nr:heparinase II/III family protein [Candidatus Limnocylindrales bacterium]